MIPKYLNEPVNVFDDHTLRMTVLLPVVLLFVNPTALLPIQTNEFATPVTEPPIVGLAVEDSKPNTTYTLSPVGIVISANKSHLPTGTVKETATVVPPPIVTDLVSDIMLSVMALKSLLEIP